MSDEKKPWERQAFDTDKSFAAFCVYRDMGSERSLEKLSQYFGKTKANYEIFSSKHRWQERVSAYDVHLDTLNLEDTEKRQKLIKDNAYSDYLLLRKAIDKQKTILEDIDFRGVQSYEISNLASLMKQADDYARRAVGLPDKISEHKQELTGKNGAPIETRNTNINIPAENAHDAGNILKQLADLGAIPPTSSTGNNDSPTE